MKRLFLAIAILLSFSATVAAQPASPQQSGSCSYCGMDLQKFAHSAVRIEYEDGSVAGTCSIHCAAVDLALNIDKTPKAIMVGDYISKRPINAENVCWTLGGDVPGVMTKRAKWAFERRSDCEDYSKAHGATIVGFDDSLKAAYEDMYSDTKMIREKRKARKMQQHQQEHQQEHQPK